eukprot:7211294-Prymnesium_polylepis.1
MTLGTTIQLEMSLHEGWHAAKQLAAMSQSATRGCERLAYYQACYQRVTTSVSSHGVPVEKRL